MSGATPDMEAILRRLYEATYGATSAPLPKPRKSTSYAEPCIFDPPIPKKGTRHKHWRDE